MGSLQIISSFCLSAGHTLRKALTDIVCPTFLRMQYINEGQQKHRDDRQSPLCFCYNGFCLILA